MDFEAWEPPSRAAMQLRALGRRLHQLTQIKTQEKNRLHAARSTDELAIVRPGIERSIESLEVQIEETQRAAMEVVNSEAELRRSFDHLCSVKGIAELSALKILGEINVLPADMNPRQWVAHAGLDPRHHDSGTSVHQPPRISKQGNKYLRAALYMPAHTAARYEPGVKRFYDRLLSRGKAKMQAKVAVMRKLLHAIYGMLKHDEDFDGARFTPAEKVA
jgi:transposase